jgi:general secretion pathway protein I
MSRSHHHTASEDGFTLLEVLVAFVILAGSLGLIYNFLISGAQRSEVSAVHMAAISLAQSKLAESEILPRQAEGETGDFHWQVRKEPQRSAAGSNRRQLVKLDHVTVTVSWRSFGGARQITLQSLRPRNDD